MMEYQIIKGYSTESLELSVNDMLNDGWEVQGGVFCEIYDGMTVYLQAMTINKFRVQR